MSPRSDVRLLARMTAVTVLAAIVGAVVLALTGHTEAAVAVAGIGAGVTALGGIQVTIHIRR